MAFLTRDRFVAKEQMEKIVYFDTNLIVFVFSMYK